jgi:hypothetical protein
MLDVFPEEVARKVGGPARSLRSCGRYGCCPQDPTSTGDGGKVTGAVDDRGARGRTRSASGGSRRSSAASTAAQEPEVDRPSACLDRPSVPILPEPQIGFRSLTENSDTTTSGGRFTFRIFGALRPGHRAALAAAVACAAYGALKLYWALGGELLVRQAPVPDVPSSTLAVLNWASVALAAIGIALALATVRERRLPRPLVVGLPAVIGALMLARALSGSDGDIIVLSGAADGSTYIALGPRPVVAVLCGLGRGVVPGSARRASAYRPARPAQRPPPAGARRLKHRRRASMAQRRTRHGLRRRAHPSLTGPSQGSWAKITPQLRIRTQAAFARRDLNRRLSEHAPRDHPARGILLRHTWCERVARHRRAGFLPTAPLCPPVRQS